MRTALAEYAAEKVNTATISASIRKATSRNGAIKRLLRRCRETAFGSKEPEVAVRMVSPPSQ